MALALAVTAAAQSEPANGWLSAGTHSSTFYASEELESWDDWEDLRCDTFGYRGSRGERIGVTLRSTAFDPWLLVGFRETDGTITGIINDDDDGLNSRVELTIDDTSRPLHIVACALHAGTGAFTLTIESGVSGSDDDVDPDDAPEHIAGSPSAPTAPTNGELRAGQPHSSSFGTGEGLETWSFYRELRCDNFDYRPQGDELIDVTMRSDDFDAWLMVGYRNSDGSITGVINDDADGLDSHVRFQTDRSGRPVRIYGCARFNRTGAYTLNVERSSSGGVAGDAVDGTERITGTPAAPSSPTNSELRVGQRHDSFLSSTEPLESWGRFRGLRCDNFDYRPQGGEVIEVTMRSDDFDALLMVGYRNSDGTITGAINDDADGLHSRVRFQADRSGRPVRIYGCARFEGSGNYALLVASGGVPAGR